MSEETIRPEKITIEGLEPTADERAKITLSAVFREESVDTSAKYITMTKSRLKLMEKLFDNLEKINEEIFDNDRYKNMATKDLVYAQGVYLKAIASLSVSMSEQKETLKQIRIEIDKLLGDSNNFSTLPQSSRMKIRDAVENVLSQFIKNSVADEVNPELEKLDKK